jgi:hypothetical protein
MLRVACRLLYVACCTYIIASAVVLYVSRCLRGCKACTHAHTCKSWRIVGTAQEMEAAAKEEEVRSVGHTATRTHVAAIG